MRRTTYTLSLATVGLGMLLVAGCDQGKTESDSFADRQNQALADPMHYKPPAHYGISDNKGINDDWHHFSNP